MSTVLDTTGSSERPTATLHLLYHELSSGPREYTYVTGTSRFAEHLELLKSLSHGSLQPRVTFDDGHMSDYMHALPLLAEHHLTARFFITAGWTGTRNGYMGWSEVRALQQAGHAIGAHGWSHALLTHCSAAELREELYHPRLLLEDKLGAAVQTMSFPGGRFNARVLQACREAGYAQMFTSRPEAVSDENSLLIGRLNLHSDVTAEWLQELFAPGSNMLPKLQRKARLKALAGKLIGDKAYAGLWALVNRQRAETP